MYVQYILTIFFIYVYVCHEDIHSTCYFILFVYCPNCGRNEALTQILHLRCCEGGNVKEMVQTEHTIPLGENPKDVSEFKKP